MKKANTPLWRRILREREAAGDSHARSWLLELLVDQGGMDPRFAMRVLEGQQFDSAVLDAILAEALMPDDTKPASGKLKAGDKIVTPAEIRFLYRR